MKKNNIKFYVKVKIVVFIALFICFLPLGFANNNSQLISYNSCLTGKEIVTGMTFGIYKTVTGTARVVTSSIDLEDINHGDIVVTVMTHESWGALLKKTAGIITNIGDSTCHAAQYGKHHSIPVLVGAGNATEKIKNGDIIIMDCSQGNLGRVYNKSEIEKKSCKSPIHVEQVGGDGSSEASYSVSQPTLHCSSKNTKARVVQGVHQQFHVTPELFHKNFKPFLSYVMDIQKTLNYWRSWGEFCVIQGAKLKCGDFEVKCIPLAYDFFDQDKKYIESVIKKIEMDYINLLFEKYNQRPGDKDWLARVLHMEHVNKITLPEGIDRNELSRHPEKYKKIIEQKKVDPRERDVLIASGLFVRYCIETKVQCI